MNHFQILFIMIGININLPMLLITLTLFSCARRSDAQCENNNVAQVIEIGHTNKIFIHFNIDSTLIDVSQYLTIKHCGPDEIKKYTNMGDTLTLRWYYGNGQLSDSTAFDVIKNRISRTPFSSCIELREIHDFHAVHGVSAQVSCNDNAFIIFYGVNNETDMQVLVEYRVKKINSDIEDSLFCLLDSMRFLAKN